MIINRITRLWRLFKGCWRPQKLDRPVVDHMFREMDAVQRSAESIRYSILSWEYWASPNGQIREWIRHNTVLAVVLAIPAIIIIPLIGCALGGIAAWAVALTVIAAHALIIPLLVVGVVIAVMFAIKFLKSIFP